MTTILRVKRRNSDEPLDALIIACKKRKINTEAAEVADSKEPLTAVVKFAGTVQNQEVNAVKEIAKTLTTDQLKANYKQHPVDIQSKARTQTQEDSRENRYKVVNCFREIESSNTDGKVNDLGMTLIDVEDSVSCTKENQDTDPEFESDFVFDLYYTMTQTMEGLMATHDNSFSIKPYTDEMVFDEKYRENDVCSDYDSEDSNCEGDWKNDYPDSEDGQSEDSIGVEDMEQAASRLWLGDEDNLSSDGEFEHFLYEMGNLKYTVDESDIENYGYAYAKFKASLKAEEEEEEEDDDDEDDDDYHCDNDSDDSNFSGVFISEIHSDEEDHEDNK